MPNMQTHLASATRILDQQIGVPWLSGDGAARCAFLLGTISPDVRAISGQQREETHFFDIPFSSNRAAQELMLERWPELKAIGGLPRTRVAFIAGYITHLVMDQTWVEAIVMPDLYIEGLAWGVKHPNWRLYSILMTYLEYRASRQLASKAIDQIEQINPEGWLPFVADQHLIAWRDRVVQQIREAGPRLLSLMFAHSNNMTSEEMEAIVLSEERMAEEVYPIVPRSRLLAFEEEAGRRSQEAILAYLAPLL